MKRDVIVTCEHASNEVPDAFKALFAGQRRVLRSHRGYDPHSLELAAVLASELDCELLQGRVSRLVVELNRSIGHGQLFSEFTRSLDESARSVVLNEYYFPYRHAVERAIGSRVQKGKTVLHLSVHTFTPVLNGKARIADVGLLFDPSRNSEAVLMEEWRQELVKRVGELKTRRNYPYHGRADGLTTEMRKKFADSKYLGIELEVRNTLRPGSISWRKLANALASLTLEFCRGV